MQLDKGSMKQQDSPRPLFLLIPAIWIFWSFGFQTVGERLWTEINGTIIESHDLPNTNVKGYVTQYIIREEDGQKKTYTTGPNDASLPKGFPLGTKIIKLRWHLSYEKNGHTVADFPIGFYSGMFGIAAGFVLWSFLQWRSVHRRIKDNLHR